MNELAEYFDRIALEGDPLMNFDEFADRVEQLLRRLGDLRGLRILEPGCGAGPLTEKLADAVGPAGRVEAFDISPAMVALACRRLAGRPNAHIAVADFETYDVGSGRWDLILLFRFFPHVRDKAQALDRLRGGLAVGGRLVIANLEGSRRLNRLHAGFGPPVHHDRMPDAESLRVALIHHGYVVREIIDQDDLFYAEAVVSARNRQ